MELRELRRLRELRGLRGLPQAFDQNLLRSEAGGRGRQDAGLWQGGAPRLHSQPGGRWLSWSWGVPVFQEMVRSWVKGLGSGVNSLGIRLMGPGARGQGPGARGQGW